ncbi:hypothetical protein BDN72DRAFT_605914 [Pluteus cervinus]|uniref:Uncharacterized protein n=1 Tax=Pluteus cervinus TaxID=181527 RepID=A0ACD3BA59_9AGAR|nr:hypothetical protein BDN72DRAFT_605914 [Pluteus cervinus]
MSSSIDPNLLFRTIQHLRYAMAGAYCIQIYDWIAMARLEHRFVHRAPTWTLMKGAYLICRYYPLVVVPIVMWQYLGNFTLETCKSMVLPINAIMTPFLFTAQGVMLVRAYAFTGRKPQILALLLVFYAILLGVDFWVFCDHYAPPPVAYYEAVGVTGCFPDHGSGELHFRLGLVKLAATSMDLVSLLVVMIHCRKTYRSQGVLVSFFVNQGLGAFAAITAINMACAIFYYQPNSAYDRVGLPFVLVVPNVIACRVILELRQKATPTMDDLVQHHSTIVRNALANCPSSNYDMWTIHEPSAHDDDSSGQS